MSQDQEETKRKRIKANYSIRYFSSYAYNRIKNKHPEYTQTDIHRAIKMYYELAQDDLSEGQKITLVNKLGGLYLTKELREVYYDEKNDKIINRLPVNIPASLELWRNKPELRNKNI